MPLDIVSHRLIKKIEDGASSVFIRFAEQRYEVVSIATSRDIPRTVCRLKGVPGDDSVIENVERMCFVRDGKSIIADIGFDVPSGKSIPRIGHKRGVIVLDRVCCVPTRHRKSCELVSDLLR